MSPEPGSSLAADSVAGLSVENPVWYSMCISSEHLDFAIDAMRATSTMYPTAYMTVARTAFVAAVNAVWDEARMSELLDRHDDVVVSGAVENQGRFYDRFEHVVLLSAPVEVLVERVATRTNNPYGRSAEQQAEIRQYVVDVEPLLRRGATLELDGRLPVGELADVIEALR